jgi:hypothetical protein
LAGPGNPYNVQRETFGTPEESQAAGFDDHEREMA